MDFKEIQDLIKLINKSDITELKLKDGDFEISLRTKDFMKNKSISYDSPQLISVAPPTNIASPTPAKAPIEDLPSSTETKASEPAANSKKGLLEIKSPIVGTFYRSSSPDKPPFVKVGDDISSGDIVCIVEAMKLFNEIETEISGKIVKVVVEDASPVEYDQVLFLVEPA